MADSTPAGQTQAPSAQQENQDVPHSIPASQPPPPSAAIPPLPPAAATSSGKRPRGRPRGSKNKSKLPIEVVAEEKPGTQHLQLQIPTGSDLVATLQNFSRQHQTGIIVDSGYGSVTNITLRPKGTPIPGIVNLVCVAGVFLDPFMYSGSMEGAFPAYMPGVCVPWLKLILTTDHTWRISRAYVVASAIAATDVLVNIITFRHLDVQRIDPPMLGIQEPAYPPAPAVPALNYGGGGGASGSGLAGDAQMAGQIPPPRFSLPDGVRKIYTPSAGVGAFRPPNCGNALNIGGGGGEASGSGLGGDAQMGGEMPPPRFVLPDGERGIYMPSAGVSAFRPPNYSNALNIGGGEASGSGSGSGGEAQIGGEMPAPGFPPPVGEQQNYAASAGAPNYPN